VFGFAEHHPRKLAQAEREAILERQREGIAKAKSQGRYKGRVPRVVIVPRLRPTLPEANGTATLHLG